MKAISYRRVSLSAEGKQDIERQVKPIQTFCERKGFELLPEGDFSDEMSGAKATWKRPGFKKLLDFIEEYPDKSNLNLVCDEISRMGRIKLDILNTIEKITSLGVNVHFVSPECSYLNQRGEVDEAADLVITLFAQVAESERKRIQSRVKSSIHRTALHGKHTGGDILYGYTINDKKELIIEKKEAEVVKDVFDKYINNIGSSALAKYLNAKGVKSRKDTKWQSTTILQMLKNECYYGKRIINGEEYSMPAIINEKTFNKAKKIRESKKNYATRTTKHVNPLVSILKCACSSTVVLSPRKMRNGEKKLKYHCHWTSNKANCGKFNTIDATLLNNSILTFFEYIIGEYGEANELIAKLEKDKQIAEEVTLPQLKQSLGGFEKKVDNLMDMSLKLGDDYSSSKFEARLDKLKQEQQQLIEKVNITEQNIKEFEEQIASIEAQGSIDSIVDIHTFKHFCQSYIKRIVIERCKREEIPYADNIFKNKRAILYKICLTPIGGSTLTFFISNYANTLIWKLIKNEETDHDRVVFWNLMQKIPSYTESTDSYFFDIPIKEILS